MPKKGFFWHFCQFWQLSVPQNPLLRKFKMPSDKNVKNRLSLAQKGGFGGFGGSVQGIPAKNRL
jgi:hypothetical protein